MLWPSPRRLRRRAPDGGSATGTPTAARDAPRDAPDCGAPPAPPLTNEGQGEDGGRPNKDIESLDKVMSGNGSKSSISKLKKKHTT